MKFTTQSVQMMEGYIQTLAFSTVQEGKTLVSLIKCFVENMLANNYGYMDI